MPGLFITFEGGEASGKSTQVKRLERRLERSGRKVLTVHEPGYTEIGSAIRQLLLHANSLSVKWSGPPLREAWLLYLTVSTIRPRFTRVLGEDWM